MLSPSPADQLPMNILYIEDDPDDVALVKVLLAHVSARRFNLIGANCMAQGLSYLASQDFDVALLDLNLPDSQGLDTFRQIHQQFPAVPIVICSSLDDTTTGIKAVQEGAQDCLTKGDFDGKALAKSLGYAVERHRLQQKAEAASRAKSEFLAVMSHELRTPLNAIIGMSQILLQTNLTPPQQDYAQTIAGSGEVLLGLVNDVLDFSKIESGHMTITRQPFNLEQCVKHAMLYTEPRAAKKNLQLNCQLQPQIPTWVHGDVARIRQVLINLLDNAIKFTPSGKVTLTVDVAERLPSNGEVKLKFAVQDTGIGISPEHSHQLFEPFTQVDSSTTRRFGGVGLGLTICQQLCERMGGKIWFESQLGKGSTFYFTLKVQVSDYSPAEVTEPAASGSGNPALVEQPPLKILLAEDNPVNQKVMLRLLQNIGYQADLAADGIEVLAALQQNTYDVILLDIQMPNMDGLEAARRIRQQWPAQQRPRLIALTAATLERDRLACQAVGIEGFLSKPVKIQDLQAALRVRHEQTASASTHQMP
ncbi:MAG: response regulator [Cyanobacteria bacterium P01_G01_bin.38]